MIKPGFLDKELYEKITASMPIVCVDIIPVRQHNDATQIGVIKRATGQEAGSLALIGGRIFYDELIDAAMARHLLNDLKITKFNLHSSNAISRPFYVQQYLRAEDYNEPNGYDPSKHSIGLTYLVTFDQEPSPQKEASSFVWLNQGDIPAKAAYAQHLVMKQAFKFLDLG